jgi:hypothetical protein
MLKYELEFNGFVAAVLMGVSFYHAWAAPDVIYLLCSLGFALTFLGVSVMYLWRATS